MAAYTTIDNPEAYFQVKLYTGDGSTVAHTLDGDTDMQPDMVWIKSRSGTYSHILHDSVRGATKELKPNGTNAEGTDTDGLTAFGSDGFSLGTGGAVNVNTGTYVAWCWQESATAGFDIVSYAGNGSAGLTVSHSLSAVPKLMIVKNRSGSYSWAVYHGANTSAPETDSLFLDVTDATSDRLAEWNDTAPTSSIFTVSDGNSVNNSSENFIAYLWRSVQGFSKFGSYTGNGNADGTFVYTGFRPAWILTKETSGVASWRIIDNKRDTINPAQTNLYPNQDSADYTEYPIDILSNGFKIKHSGGGQNESGASYIYMAFAEAPFVNSNGVPCNAR